MSSPSKSSKDIEKNGVLPAPPDPFELRTGIQSELQLSAIRKRPKGKKLEKYHRTQNEVTVVKYLSPIHG